MVGGDSEPKAASSRAVTVSGRSLAVAVVAVVGRLHPIFVRGDGLHATVDRQLLLEHVGLGLLGVVSVPPGISAFWRYELLLQISVGNHGLG